MSMNLFLLVFFPTTSGPDLAANTSLNIIKRRTDEINFMVLSWSSSKYKLNWRRIKKNVERRSKQQC